MNTETWIPVCKRLPAVSEPVLTYDEASRTLSIAFLNNGRWLRDYPDPMLRIEVRVTYWQPLPEPPPKPDPFEEFWNHDVLRVIGTAGLASNVLKAWCKRAFEAGISSTQNK